MENIKDEVIAKTLKRLGTQEAAAKELGISRDTIQRRGKKSP